jgi:iron complex transport system substrate-binding protein
MRICSLLPSATEILCALGLEDQLVAITHECDYPPSILSKPRITRSAIDHAGSTSGEIHRHISSAIHQGSSIYNLDQGLLERLDPDLILTQELCDVCAVSYQDVKRAVRVMDSRSSIISLEPNTLGDILETIRQVGGVTGRQPEAAQVAAGLQQRIERVTSAASRAAQRPRVLCLEWYDPPMVGGHWVPEMVEQAGGVDGLGKVGQPSVRVSWERIAEYRPEVVALLPCGYHLRENVAELGRTTLPPQWRGLPAVQQGQVYALDGSSYFNRPGPRIVDGLEILAEILHPELFPRRYGPEDWRRVATTA